MATTTLIKEVVKTAFEKVYGADEECAENEFNLLVLGEYARIGHVQFAIVQYNNGVICEFSASDTGIYQASSKGDLLASKYQLDSWVKFLNLVKETLEEIY